MTDNLLLQKEYENLINKLSIGTDNGNIKWIKYYDTFICTIKDRVFELDTTEIHWMIEGLVNSICLGIRNDKKELLDSLSIRTGIELNKSETVLRNLLIALYTKLQNLGITETSRYEFC